jgi:hypothetical protein
MGVEVGTAIEAGGKATGAGLVALAFVKLVMFLFKWCGERWDAHVRRVTEREAIADKSIANRIRHLELQQERDARLIGGLYRALNVLTMKVAEINPFDPALVEVRDIITAALRETPSDTPQDLESMIDQLRGEP